MMGFGFMKEGSTAIDFVDFISYMNEMTREEQNIIFKMYRKCNKKNKDLCEMAYQLNICAKKNDNVHYYLFDKPGFL